MAKELHEIIREQKNGLYYIEFLKNGTVEITLAGIDLDNMEEEIERLNFIIEANDIQIKDLREIARRKILEKQDAIFMANVWESIQSQGWQSITEFGDIDGIQFVADRILEGYRPEKEPSHDPYSKEVNEK